MHLSARHRIDTSPLEALRASMRDWLVATLLWLVESLEPLRANAPAWLRAAIVAVENELDRELRDTARDLRRMLIVHAFARLALPVNSARRPLLRPLSVERRAQRNSFARKATATTLKGLHAGSLKQRAERLRNLLDNIAPLYAETFAHMQRLFTAPRLPGVKSTIAHDARPAATRFFALTHVDTS